MIVGAWTMASPATLNVVNVAKFSTLTFITMILIAAIFAQKRKLKMSLKKQMKLLEKLEKVVNKSNCTAGEKSMVLDYMKFLINFEYQWDRKISEHVCEDCEEGLCND